MQTETRKIALACFVGAALCGLIIALVAPALWWLGTLAGFAAGYIAFEFKEFWAAIPIAYRKAKEKSPLVVRAFKKPRPVFYFAGLYTYFVFVVSQYFLPPDTWFIPYQAKLPTINLVMIAIIFSIGIGTVTMLCTLGIAVAGMAFVDKEWERSELGDVLFMNAGSDESQKKPLTYATYFYYQVIGIVAIAYWLCWGVWYQLVCFFLRSAKEASLFVGRFIKYLFILIHSEKRLLCGVDSAIGGTIVGITLYSHASSLSALVVIVLCGGFLGAFLGVLNWEIVSKRILHVDAPPA